MDGRYHTCRKCDKPIWIPSKAGKYHCKCGNMIEVINRVSIEDVLATSLGFPSNYVDINVGRASVEKRILEHAKTINPAYIDETVEMTEEDFNTLGAMTHRE